MKNKINILIKDGCIRAIMIDRKEVDIDIFNLDNDPELEEHWDEVTKNQYEVDF